MKRFKNILVVYDDAIGGDDALGQAVGLARANAARLTIVTFESDRQSSANSFEETEKRLRRLGLGVRSSGVSEVYTAVLTGSPYQSIIRRVVGDGHDLVIASAEAGSVFQNVFFGGTAMQLMRKCPCPVWVVSPGRSVPYSKILVAVDLNDLEEASAPLTIKLLDLATSLASRDGAVLHIMHAWDVSGPDADTIRSEISSPQRRSILDRHEQKNRTALNALLARYPLSDINHRIHLPRDRPGKAITRLVEQEKIDLLVMGTVARTGIPRLIAGNAAETVLETVKCGMLAVKSDGFETPDLLPAPTETPGSAGDGEHYEPARRIA